MIKATALPQKYQTILSNGHSQAIADVTGDKGGQGDGLRPHDLLAASLAACISITLRMAADKHGFELGQTDACVDLNRDDPERVVFEYHLKFDEALTQAQRRYLSSAVANCPVKSTLSKRIEFNAIVA